MSMPKLLNEFDLLSMLKVLLRSCMLSLFEKIAYMCFTENVA